MVRLEDVASAGRTFARDADDLVVAAFEAHRVELYTFLVRTVRDDADAQDLLQETFLRLSKEVRAGRPPLARSVRRRRGSTAACGIA